MSALDKDVIPIMENCMETKIENAMQMVEGVRGKACPLRSKTPSLQVVLYKNRLTSGHGTIRNQIL